MTTPLKDTPFKLKRIFIESKLPEGLNPLRELANNLWWSWNKDAIELFRSIDEPRWAKLEYNPLRLLDEMSPAKAEALLADQAFMGRLQAIDREFKAYLKAKPAKGAPRIAYFSMEYGLHISLHLYSGGLGVLAGDYLKEASDCNTDMVAVGLLYRYGYFQQSISLNGEQVNNYPAQKFTLLPLQPVFDDKGEWLKLGIGIKGRLVFAKVWELSVGRIPLYLLDTDLDENSWEDRKLTHQLYGGDNEHRLRQEILLGIGGIQALQALGIAADVYHCNEGHAAFMGLERLRGLIQEAGLSFEEALETVRASSLFTTHTPVPAGHDYFHPSLLAHYFQDYASRLGISWERFVALGQVSGYQPDELFSMSHLAIRLAQKVNGVSKLHGSVSQEMFSKLYPGYHPRELHIGYVTNSVHYHTWIAPEWHDLYEREFGPAFLQDQSNHDYWRKIHNVTPHEIMGIRRQLKRRLLRYVKASLREDLLRRGENPRAIFEVTNAIDEEALVLGFARRFATYKRAHLLFTNPERLSQIVNQTGRPVLFLYAGKAHPADHGGQELIKHIVSVSKRPEFAGKVIFLENYNMEMAKLLVQGVDIWLNTPTRPQEASGTSGMKAALNGVMNFSVLDGWWAEGYRPDAGWALPMEKTYAEQHLQNELDAETIYNTLEHEIVPAFFQRDEQGIPLQWVSHIKNTIAEIAPEFTMKRMLDHYFERFYYPLHERGKAVRAEGFKLARQLAAWKGEIQQRWDAIQVLRIDAFDSENRALPVGQPFTAEIELRLNGLRPEHVGLEVAFFRRTSDDAALELELTSSLEPVASKGEASIFRCTVDPKLSGVFEYGFRMFPQHPALAHRQDLPLVRWL